MNCQEVGVRLDGEGYISNADELAIIQGIINGLNNKQITDSAGLSFEQTVKTRDSLNWRFKDKLEDPNDDGLMRAVVYAVERDLVDISSLPEMPSRPLAPRKDQVLQLLRLGYKRKHIADELGIPLSVVDSGLKSINRLFGVDNRYKVVAMVVCSEKRSSNIT
jgi:DNA-binding NarL/FixJ family response regulator